MGHEHLLAGESLARLSGVEIGWTPELEFHAENGQCRLSLVGVTYGKGESLQEASNDLMVRLFDLAVAFRDGRHRMSVDAAAQRDHISEFLREIGEIAASGGDIRGRVLGVPQQRGPMD